MMNDNASEKITASNCEKELIHIPGLIQPFGLLLCLNEQNLRIDQISSNILKETGRTAESLLGKHLSTLISVRDVEALEIFLKLEGPKFPIAQRFELKKGGGMIEAWHGFIHRQGKYWILELEKGTLEYSREANYLNLPESSISEIQATRTLKSLFDFSVREVQRITGFNRVMMYRFDSAWNGEVVAEARSGTGVDSFFGHLFPASDIPAQARAVFLSNWLRMIPDVGYNPVPVVPTLHPDTNAPLDMSLSLLRSVSPLHIQYLQNMKVGSTLTISLIDGGNLWGIISCHHSIPKMITQDIRSACRFIGKLVSSRLSLKEQFEDIEYGRELTGVHASLVAAMAKEDDLVRGLVNYTPNIQAVAGASGAAVAVQTDGEWTLVGQTPSVQQIDKLSYWLSEQMIKITTGGGGEVFHTDKLSMRFPEASQYSNVASGLLAIQIPKADRCFIMWFKPEILKTVTWAGNPQKNVERMPDGSLKIEPRASFERWKEIVNRQASPWKSVEIDAALNLKHAIVDFDLKRQFQKEQIARTKAERVVREKEELLATVSHDLKSPLSAIDLRIQLFERKYTKMGVEVIDSTKLLEEIRASHSSIKSSTKRMERLIHDLLDIAKMEDSSFVLNLKSIEIEQLFREVLNIFRPFAEEKNIRIEFRLSPDVSTATLDEDRIIQALSNLVGNALKFTPNRGVITLAVENSEQQIIISVQDSGAGISADHLPHVFDRFWQVQATNAKGTGLGLAICKSIVEAHKGKIWIESILEHGTKIFFSLPLQ